jgi:hypothetical protein
MEPEDDLAQALGLVYATRWPDEVEALLITPDGRGTSMRLEEALDVIDDRVAGGLPDFLLPLAIVDETSIACVAIDESVEGIDCGAVVRLHLTDVPLSQQVRLLDTDPLLYIESLAFELTARDEGLKRLLDEIGPAYQGSYLDHDKRPRDFIVRPVRIACQNVIVALGAIAQDSAFDGLSVVAWQTCEVPHVATHEANRALAALTLADAFQNGGTMEIRFDRTARVIADGVAVDYKGHPEGGVPASLRRFGRTVGVELGADDAAAITPAEARALFLAITPMPPGLRERVEGAIARRGIAPERLCFTLLSQIWREIELDFILASTDRAQSILEGGADWRERSARQAEMDVTRCALIAGMLFRRLNGRDAAGASDGPRVVEDVSLGVEWTILDDIGAIQFGGLDAGSGLPWVHGQPRALEPELTVFMRSHISERVAEQAATLQATGKAVAIAVPLDAAVPPGLVTVPLLRCPDRSADLDKQAEARLLTSRISRG